MSSTIVATAGSSSANSYVTLANADARFLADALWEAESAAKREALLIRATRDVEELGGARSTDSPRRALFAGEPYSYLQALHFPRPEDINASGAFVVPKSVQDAVCEQARYLLEQERNPAIIDHAALREAGVQLMQADGANFQYGTPTDTPPGIGQKAWRLIRPYVRRGFTVRL